MIDTNKLLQVRYEGGVEWHPAWFVGADMRGLIVVQVTKNGSLYSFSKEGKPEGTSLGRAHQLRNTPTKTKLFFFTVRNSKSGVIDSYVSTLPNGSSGYKCLPANWETIDCYEREIEL